MMKTILTVLFFMAFASLNPCGAQPLPTQTPTNAPPVPVSPQTSNPPIGVTQPPVVQPPPADMQPQAVATSPTTSPPVITTPPADIGSLIAKEVLSANNQVVSQVASMYQNLGLFITIIVTLVGGVATWMSYVARKSVHEFIQEWTEKMKSLENDMKEASKRLHETVAEAENSAQKAAGYERSIEDSKKVLSKTLEDVDRLRAGVASLHDQLRREEAAGALPKPVTEVAIEQPITEPLIAEEDEEVAVRLKGKINPAEGEGQEQ